MWVKNPGGRVVAVADDSVAAQYAKAGEHGWTVADDPEAPPKPKPEPHPKAKVPRKTKD